MAHKNSILTNGRVRLKENGMLDEEPPTLLETAFKCVAANFGLLIADRCPGFKQDDVRLPNEICDRFIRYYQDLGNDVNDTVVEIFSDPQRTPLRHVHLRNCTVTDTGMRSLLGHQLHSLTLWYCDSVTKQCWPDVVANAAELRHLEIGRYVDLLKHTVPNERYAFDFQLNLPRLQKLQLNAVVLRPNLLFTDMPQLGYLDLSACSLNGFSLRHLIGLQHLHTLILFNVWPLEAELKHIYHMANLRVLDISTGYGNNNIGDFTDPNRQLTALVEALPLLEYLDISGTNLAGTGVALESTGATGNSSDIPGLVSRADRPLQFLGLYNTAHGACRRFAIPAMTVSGEANESQILTSAMIYLDRPIMLTKVLNDLYHMLRFECCESIHCALDVVLLAMDRHVRVKHMQISGSATLFYIVKGHDKSRFCTQLKNHIIRSLLNGMSTHLSDDTMMRNGCLTLCQFAIPNDVLFEYERLVKILLHGVAESEQEGFVQRIAIYLLNSLACQVDGRQKLFLGDLGAIGTMLNLISDRLQRKVFDDVMEVAWSTMWNVTDETPLNCERFLNADGMEFFLGCLESFPDKEELVRNMMGLLGNVAEVKSLRNRLMSSKFIQVFSDLLTSSTDGIEVSYNAAGVLAHIASDGPDAWVIESPSRSHVLLQMVNAIDRWDLNAERNINYRSFEPILALLRCYDTPECQHWAVWALANLTKVYPLKYSPLVGEEHGMELLHDLLNHPMPPVQIKNLARMVVDNCGSNNDRAGEPMDG